MNVGHQVSRVSDAYVPFNSHHWDPGLFANASLLYAEKHLTFVCTLLQMMFVEFKLLEKKKYQFSPLNFPML